MGLEIGGGISIGAGIMLDVTPDLADYISTELDQRLLTENNINLVTESS